MPKAFSLLIAAIAVAAIVFFLRNDAKNNVVKQLPAKNTDMMAVRKRVDWSKVIKEKARRPVEKCYPVPEQPTISPAAQALVDAIEKAYEDDDLKTTLSLAPKARMSAEKAVREAMLWSLGWFGKPALSELVPFLADSDDEIANDALRCFNDVLQEFEDEGERISIVELVMMKITSPVILEDVAMEYIGVGDRQAVESLLRVIERGTEAGRRQAYKTYESVTGEKFTTSQAARKWVENYTL